MGEAILMKQQGERVEVPLWYLLVNLGLWTFTFGIQLLTLFAQ